MKYDFFCSLVLVSILQEFLEIARSDLSLRQANLEEAWEKKKQAEADKVGHILFLRSASRDAVL